MEVLTGLAGVSLRTCRLPAPHRDAVAATGWRWSNPGKLSILYMVLLRTITMSQQFQRGGKSKMEK